MAKTTFKSLDEMADWFQALSEYTAKEAIGYKPVQENLMLREARAYLIAADLLRNSRIKPEAEIVDVRVRWVKVRELEIVKKYVKAKEPEVEVKEPEKIPVPEVATVPEAITVPDLPESKETTDVTGEVRPVEWAEHGDHSRPGGGDSPQHGVSERKLHSPSGLGEGFFHEDPV